MSTQKRTFSPDLIAMLVLFLTWIMFFWRVWTPVQTDQLTFAEGDFSAQFVTWTDYAVSRLKDGDIPLWNPYQYGGAPFQASPQTQLTYPPHMLTLGSLLPQGEVQRWEVYVAMQREVMIHILLASLFVYLFVRRLIIETPEMTSHHASFGGLAAGLTYAYGGYAAGYPILQAPLLAAGVWLPLILLGILEATRESRPRLGWGWLGFSGVMFGVCLLAGHPQTAWFSFYMAAAWLAYRVWRHGWSWRLWLIGIVLIAVLGAALAAVQLLPTAEFTAHSYRLDLTFNAKGGGYSFEELVNILFPIRGKIWNSNHFGIVALVLAGIAIWRRVKDWGFFAAVLGAAFLLSFGERTPVFGVLYYALPGLSLFRGQERAVFLMAHCLAILSGLGAARMLSWCGWREYPSTRQLRRVLIGLTLISAAYTVALYFLAQTSQRSDTITGRMDGGALTTLLFGALLLGLEWFVAAPTAKPQQIALIGLLIFDLFSVTYMLGQNYQAVPLGERILNPPYMGDIQRNLGWGDRVDSLGGYERGYGTLYRVPDLQGSDPLQLEAAHFYLEELAPVRRWELLNIRVVIQNPTDTYFPVPGEVPAQPISGYTVDGQLLSPIWSFDNPRGFARLVYQIRRVNTQEEAFSVLHDPAFDARNVIILERDIALDAPTESSPTENVTIISYEPEAIAITVSAPQEGVLSLALPYFPGWEAKVDDQDTELLRAYGGLSAVSVPQGDHVVEVHYHSRWLRLGTLISAVAWLLVGLWGMVGLGRSRLRM